MVELGLIVIRSEDIEATARFYETIGLEFELERHGKGPEHYAARIGSAIFEIYPVKGEATRSIRLGFKVENVDETYSRLLDQGATIETSPSDSPWGRRAVVADPNGRLVELTQPTGESP